MIASMSKSLATLMMAKLVDEGAFTWSTPVTTVLPSFALGDPEATKKLTMRHTVCACTGMPRQDGEFLFEYGSATPESRVESMRGMKLTTGFGETFQYSNTMVATGGFAAAHAAEPKKSFGPAFDAALRAKVLVPYGMKATTLDPNVARRVDHASPHGLGPDTHPHVTPIANDDEPFAAVRPAGGVWSTVEDFARVIQVELGRGMLDGKRVVSEENLLARREPQAKIYDKAAYGLGLFLEQRNKVSLIGHGGNLYGYTSDYFFLPDHGVGMVVLTNAGSANAFRNALKRRLLEVVFDGRAEAKENLAFGLDRRKQAADTELSRVAQKPSAAFVERLVGTWTSPGLGKLIVRKENDRAVLDVGEWASAFGEKTDPDGAKALFVLDAPHAGTELLVQEQDGKATLVLDMEQQKYVFRREGSPKP
jgi:CubicO group peptidase (beta-lactamase class C family)